MYRAHCRRAIVDARQDEPRIFVESEDQPDRMLLETKIQKDDGYQKQQDTLIVWTEANGTDMALSFQEADGCAVIW
jgi:protein phosphatase 4 regulatory subunit 3